MFRLVALLLVFVAAYALVPPGTFADSDGSKDEGDRAQVAVPDDSPVSRQIDELTEMQNEGQDRIEAALNRYKAGELQADELIELFARQADVERALSYATLLAQLNEDDLQHAINSRTFTNIGDNWGVSLGDLQDFARENGVTLEAAGRLLQSLDNRRR